MFPVLSITSRFVKVTVKTSNFESFVVNTISELNTETLEKNFVDITAAQIARGFWDQVPGGDESILQALQPQTSATPEVITLSADPGLSGWTLVSCIAAMLYDS